MSGLMSSVSCALPRAEVVTIDDGEWPCATRQVVATARIVELPDLARIEVVDDGPALRRILGGEALEDAVHIEVVSGRVAGLTVDEQREVLGRRRGAVVGVTGAFQVAALKAR